MESALLHAPNTPYTHKMDISDGTKAPAVKAETSLVLEASPASTEAPARAEMDVAVASATEAPEVDWKSKRAEEAALASLTVCWKPMPKWKKDGVVLKILKEIGCEDAVAAVVKRPKDFHALVTFKTAEDKARCEPLMRASRYVAARPCVREYCYICV